MNFRDKNQALNISGRPPKTRNERKMQNGGERPKLGCS